MNLVPRPPLHDVTDEQIAAYFLSLIEGNNPEPWAEYVADVISSGRTDSVILRNLQLDGKKINGFRFAKVFFIDSQIIRCELHDCHFTNCRLQDTEISRSILQGCEIKSLEKCTIAIKDSVLKNCKFDRVNCPESIFQSCTIENVEFSQSNFNKSKFTECKTSNLSFKETKLIDADFNESELNFLGLKNSHVIGANFSRSKLNNANFSGQSFDQANFSEADLQMSIFSDCHLQAVNFNSANLSKAQFFSNIEHSNFRQANLEGAFFCKSAKCKSSAFDKANLKCVNFSFVDFEDCSFIGSILIKANLYKSRFTQSNFFKCKIDKYSLAFVERDNIGASDRMVMDIIDDSEKLRLDFSGIWAFSHTIALFIFLFPYAWFVVENWAIAQFTGPSEKHITLIQALFIYIYNGGQDVSSGQANFHWSFSIFLLLTAYNSLRFILLMKTKKIEHEHTITEKPSAFSFEDKILRVVKWGYVYRLSRILFFVALLIAIFNFCYFMTRSIPISSL